MNGAMLLTLLTFTAVFLLIAGVNFAIGDVLERNRKKRQRQMELDALERQRLKARDSVQQSVGISLDQMAMTAASEQEPKKGPIETLREALEQADLQFSPMTVIVLMISFGAGVGVIVHLLVGNFAGSLGAGALAAVLPVLYVFQKRKQRIEEMQSQLPDALELMSRVLRAGQTMNQAMQAVGQEFKAPLGPEFAYCYEQQNLGMSMELSLRDLAKRTGLLEIRIFVLALIVHRQSGGNLTELLDKLSSIIRERFKLRGKIRAMTAEGRLQAAILLGLPFFMFVLLLFMNRDYALELFDHPNMMAGMLFSMAIGTFWIRKIVNFDF